MPLPRLLGGSRGCSTPLPDCCPEKAQLRRIACPCGAGPRRHLRSALRGLRGWRGGHWATERSLEIAALQMSAHLGRTTSGLTGGVLHLAAESPTRRFWLLAGALIGALAAIWHDNGQLHPCMGMGCIRLRGCQRIWRTLWKAMESPEFSGTARKMSHATMHSARPSASKRSSETS